MKYMGSKARLFKHIGPIIQGNIKHVYVEPFAGGMNMIDKVHAPTRIAADLHPELIAMWEALVSGWVPDKYYNREEYDWFKDGGGEPHERGYVGFCCSYSGKYFGGFAGITNTKGGIRNYQTEAWNNIKKQIKNVVGVRFYNTTYDMLEIPDGSTIYCDPPYKNTTGYRNVIDHDKFWQWVRDKSRTCTVFVSEYTAPNDMIEIWSGEFKSSLSANGKGGSSKKSVEKLFTYL